MYWVHSPPQHSLLGIVTVMTIVIVWVDLSIPILTKHVFIIAFISIVRDSHIVRNHSMCNEAPQYDLGTKILHALKLSSFFST